MTRPSIATVIVSHRSLPDLRRTLPALTAQLAPGDELIVVDNGGDGDLAAALADMSPRARVVGTGDNVGFAAGANAGAGAATADILLLLNPDAVPQDGFLDAIGALHGQGWAGWMGLVTMGGGREINTSGGVLHFTGIGWAGQAHEPVAAAPRGPVEVGFLSGACLAVPRDTWNALGGFPEPYFMYCEDVDLSLRLRLRGGRLGLAPDARVDHSYSFDKGAAKWRLLERNRWATVIRTYPLALLMLVIPALIATELAIWATAVRGGWGSMKARATRDVLVALPRLVRERAGIQRARTITAAAFARALTDELSSPYLAAAKGRPRLARAQSRYWRLTLAALERAPRGATA